MTGDLDPKCGWKARAEDLSTSLVTVAQERDEARSELEALRAASVELRAEYDALRDRARECAMETSRILAWGMELSGTPVGLTAVARGLRELERQRDAAQPDRASLLARIETATKELEDLRRMNELLQVQRDDAERKADTARAEVGRWEAMAKNVQAHRLESDSERDAAKAALDAATSPVPGLADSGPYTLADVELIERHRGKPYARLRETVKALDAAKAEALVMSSDCPDNSCQACARCYDAAMADAARLREALNELRAVTLTIDSGAWLEQRIAERTADLERAAARNDAARAELRARDAVEAASEFRKAANAVRGQETEGTEKRYDSAYSALGAVLAAAPDSDARLREVMAHAIRNAVDSKGSTATKFWVDGIIDEVLGVKP